MSCGVGVRVDAEGVGWYFEKEDGQWDQPFLAEPFPLPTRGTSPVSEYTAKSFGSFGARQAAGRASQPRPTDDCCAVTDAERRLLCAPSVTGDSGTARWGAAGQRGMRR